MTPQLFQDWRSVADRLREAPSIALFLDFDGTLAPLAAEPRNAVMNRAARIALLRLAGNPGVRTWVISGRRQADLRMVVGEVPGLTYIGVHGSDAGASGAPLPKEVLRIVAEARRELASSLNGSASGANGAGVLIEDKGMAFAVHHRHAPEPEVGRARQLLDRVIAELGGALRIVSGDRVWEVLPREIRGKGDAVRREWRQRSPEALPIYIGNDGTDESAFAALAGGITVRVGPLRPTRAHYALRNAAEVARFLEQLEKEMRWTNCPASNS
jgi:trehalose 6-phosphate phosphatase